MIAYCAGVITRVKDWRGRITRFGQRYQAWEDRRHRGRLAGWSTRRRYVVLVLLPTVLCCCGGGVVGVPVAWVLRETVAAGRGAVSPDAAASEYLMDLSYGTEDGLLPLLHDEHQGELLPQFRAYRAAMESTDPAPSRLSFGSLDVGPIRDGRAEVTTSVSANWWDVDDNGRNLMYQSDEFEWRIETREDDGWRVSAVHAPAWCGGYVRAETCRAR